MDPVNHKALKGKFKDREDKDIDNNGKVDSSDEYLHKRRQAVSKAIGKIKEETLDEKRGLWDNIHAKRKRIEAGSGEKMRKPGSKGAPTDADFKNASESNDLKQAFIDSMQSKLKKRSPLRDPNAKTAREEDKLAKQLAAKQKMKEEVELDEEVKYVVKGKSPFYKQDHYINTHETPKAQLIKKNIKHATRMNLETAKKVAKDWESHPNKYEIEVVPVNEALLSVERNEEVELDEQAMTFQNAEKLKNKHLVAMDHHKKSGNSKGYAAHSMVVRKFEDVYDRHGTGVIPAGRILSASQKAFKDHPHSNMKEETNLSEAETMYVIKHKKTKQVLNTHSDYATAKDEHEGLGADKHEYGVYKQTKKDAALRNRNTYRESVELDEVQISWHHNTQKYHTIKHPDGSHWGVFDHRSYGTKGHEIRKIRDSEGKPIKAADSRKNHSAGYKSGMGSPSDAAKEWAKKHGGTITNHKIKEETQTELPADKKPLRKKLAQFRHQE